MALAFVLDAQTTSRGPRAVASESRLSDRARWRWAAARAAACDGNGAPEGFGDAGPDGRAASGAGGAGGRSRGTRADGDRATAARADGDGSDRADGDGADNVLGRSSQ